MDFTNTGQQDYPWDKRNAATHVIDLRAQMSEIQKPGSDPFCLCLLLPMQALRPRSLKRGKAQEGWEREMPVNISKLSSCYTWSWGFRNIIYRAV